MKTWFETKISYEKEVEGGMMKIVTESYLVDALSFTEAEAKIITEMKPYITGEFSIAAIKRQNYVEVFGLDAEKGDRYYACKLEFICLDETGAEKRTVVNMLVCAFNIDEAKTSLHECMKGTEADYEVVAIRETKLIDVFVYVPKEEESL